MSDPCCREGHPLTAADLLKWRQLEARLASVELELTHAARTCAIQQRRAEEAEARLAEAERDAQRFVWWFTIDPHDLPEALDVPNNATIDDFRRAIDAAMATYSAPAADQPLSAMSAEEHCRLFRAWKGDGPCLADDCPRRTQRQSQRSLHRR